MLPSHTELAVQPLSRCGGPTLLVVDAHQQFPIQRIIVLAPWSYSVGSKTPYLLFLETQTTLHYVLHRLLPYCGIG